jgi:hypothetical protein
MGLSVFESIFGRRASPKSAPRRRSQGPAVISSALPVRPAASKNVGLTR